MLLQVSVIAVLSKHWQIQCISAGSSHIFMLIFTLCAISEFFILLLTFYSIEY